jgi:hypothetical protein
MPPSKHGSQAHTTTVQLISCDGATNFFPSWPQTTVLQISASQVAMIIGMTHHTRIRQNSHKHLPNFNKELKSYRRYSQPIVNLTSIIIKFLENSQMIRN